MKEIWRDIKGYDGIYQVSNLGRVRNAKTLRLKKLETRYDEYLFVRFHNNGYSGMRSVHRLVAEAFIENKNPDKNQVNHKNGIKTDNRANNLEWVTQSENLRHAALSLRKPLGGRYAIRVRCVETNSVYQSIGEAARKTGLSKGHIAKVLKKKEGRTQTGGFHWEFA